MKNRLYEMLTEYGKTDYYPFHMPGHKRRTGDCPELLMGDPFGIDLTEIDWNDNLHHAEGILKKSMEDAAGIYGASRSFYLVNGSTCGILSAIAAAVKPGGRILMARNCHKSAYHGVILNRLDIEYIYPQNLWKYGVHGGLVLEEIEAAVDKCGEIDAVFLTSPTYEGIVSDVEKIVQAMHRRKVPVIVDEAHGAHLTFGENFPKSAVDCGADLVIQSLHKTLPALTQTAILHLNRGLIDEERLERYLRIYQTSSPSYVFMASMENCIRYMNGPGRERMKEFGDRVRRLTEELQGLRTMSVPDDSVIGTAGVFDKDPSKLVIAVNRDSSGNFFRNHSGRELAGILRDRYHLETEMSNVGYVLAMTSLMDDEEGFLRLRNALFEIDEDWARERLPDTGAEENEKAAAVAEIRPEAVMPMWKALEEPAEDVELSAAKERISADFVMVYPPGIPFLAPGERITGEILEKLTAYLQMGYSLEGLKGDGERRISVLKG